jgi:hypothetical protein
MEKWSNWNGQIDGIDGMFFSTSMFQLLFSAAFVKELLTICFCNKECSDTIGWKQD